MFKKCKLKSYAFLLLILVSTLVLTGCRKKQPEQPQAEAPKKKIQKPVNVLPYEQRPYVLVAPTISREVVVTVNTLPKPADSVEYLAEYQYGTTLGGNEQSIPLSTLPASKEFALYSRSAGGKTSYEEDVQGGTLTLTFISDDEYVLKQDWNYIDNKIKTDTFSSRDNKFTLQAPELKNVRYGIVYNSPGLPAPITGKRVSEVYTFATTGGSAKTPVVTIQMANSAQGTILGWDGKTWKEFNTQIEGDKASATVQLMQAYVVVEK